MSNKYKHGKYRISIAGDKNIQNKVVSITDDEGDDVLSGGSIDISGKADKVSNVTNGNFAGLDANGNLTDSGKKASDFAIASQGAKADTAYQKPSRGIPESDLSSDVQQALQKHFKGWYNTLAELKAAHTAVDGDSAYVKDASPATTWSIYIYDSTASSDNFWADSGTDADTTYVQTFASGEELNEVHIVNDLTTGGTTDAASAETVKTLGEDIYGEIVEGITEEELISDKYHKIKIDVGTIDLEPTNSSTGTYCCKIPVVSGDKFIIKGLGGTAWSKLYGTCDSNGVLKRHSGDNLDTRSNPLEITIQNDEDFLVCNLKYQEGDYVGKITQTQNGGLIDRVDELEGQINNTIEIDLPNVIYAIVGDTLQLYYKSIFRCVNPYIYDIKVTCNIGAQYPRYYELTPVIGQVGEYNISFVIKDNNNNILGNKTVTLKVVNKVNNPGAKNILCVGASNTRSGQWPSELRKRLTTSNGSGTNPPIGFSIPNISFVGRKSVTYNVEQINLEATGGYNFTTYITANAAYVRFFFTQEQVPFGITIGDKYTDGTTEYTIEEINIPNNLNGYYGNINCEVISLPSSVGLQLTRVTGSGDSSITASSSSQSGNPFAYDGVIDIEQYAEDYCNSQIDIVYTELFGNGLVTQYQEDFTTSFQKMQTFIDMFLAVFPNCKFCLNVMQNKDEEGGLGVNYGAGTSAYAYPYGLKYGCHNLLTKLQEYINDNNLQDYVFIVNTLNEFDCENDYLQTQKPVNIRSGVTEIFGVNGAHPSEIGYYQMADAATRTFIAHFCQ